MNKGKMLRVACVGAGYFSQFHYGSWARMDRVKLVGACDQDLQKARATGLPAFDDLPLMLADVAPDLLDIILPPAAHAAAVRAALAAGVKSIICQKPFCTDLEQAHQILAEAEQAGARIVIHENFRFQPWYRCIRTALDDGMIGDVLQLTFRLRPGDGQGPDAYLDRQPYFQKMSRFLIRETGVHWVDTFRFLLGEPLSVYADLRQVNPAIAGEDAGYVIFEHAGGIRALLDANRCLDHVAENHRRTMGEALVEGTQGTLMLTGDGAVTLRRFGTSDQLVLLPPNCHQGFGGDCVHHLQSHVVSGILDGSPLENLGRDYLSVMQTEDAIYRSADTGCKQTLEAM
ncbi:Gfo/Idh/MocA family protein [Paracoccus benzoatiresistens]|uniref:Gfo/Idh/MocA family oxidoreductase n=1 Tax=Paracoccus benzoatiresistens TaxID=2997341 RepID=A0ABT4JBI2_9RHOB|nr:Gfo/Idh/MocA family oxidoreductase [Paracoccus sp. EF6]MCZ0963942.1 Gfo/Idh/MocA family oxidoreductase [Paracoccus sp. EF6]